MVRHLSISNTKLVEPSFDVAVRTTTEYLARDRGEILFEPTRDPTRPNVFREEATGAKEQRKHECHVEAWRCINRGTPTAETCLRGHVGNAIHERNCDWTNRVRRKGRMRLVASRLRKPLGTRSNAFHRCCSSDVARFTRGHLSMRNAIAVSSERAKEKLCRNVLGLSATAVTADVTRSNRRKQGASAVIAKQSIERPLSEWLAQARANLGERRTIWQRGLSKRVVTRRSDWYPDSRQSTPPRSVGERAFSRSAISAPFLLSSCPTTRVRNDRESSIFRGTRHRLERGTIGKETFDEEAGAEQCPTPI